MACDLVIVHFLDPSDSSFLASQSCTRSFVLFRRDEPGLTKAGSKLSRTDDGRAMQGALGYGFLSLTFRRTCFKLWKLQWTHNAAAWYVFARRLFVDVAFLPISAMQR